MLAFPDTGAWLAWAKAHVTKIRTRSLAVLAVLAASSGCDSRTEDTLDVSTVPVQSASAPDLELRVREFCGACHAVPLPGSFPKSEWHAEVSRGYDFYFRSGRRDLSPPPQSQVAEYYQSRAPERLEPPPVGSAESTSPVSFRMETVAGPPRRMDGPTAVSFLEWQSPGGGSGLFWISDMQRGEILRSDITGDVSWKFVCRNPVAIRTCDLNANGQADLLVAELGSFLPEDHNRGRLLWIADYMTSEAAPVALLEGIGRVADVCIADLDGDGDSDLVVAEFGWQDTGGIHVLWNEGRDGDAAAPRFSSEVVDRRSGTIHVRPVDLNRDGRLDFVALISQEHETVVAFLNTESGFEQAVLFTALDPSHGSSGIELIDLDQDGDIDVLYTNGDTFDSHLVKPYHGVSWLENRGSFPFVEHRLASMPGVLSAIPADLDGDGDLDIVAVALLPERTLADHEGMQFDSIIWLEQTSPGEFQRHVIERGSPVHAAACEGDFDGDGDIDIAVGSFMDQKQPDTYFKILWNDGPARKSN